MVYNYHEEMSKDIKAYIVENNCIQDYESLDDANQSLYDILFVEDSVTGNASGSYTCNSAKAEEYVAGNQKILVEAMREFDCMDAEHMEKALTDAEWCDVTIRCYLLGSVLSKVLDEMTDNGKIWENSE